MAETKYPLSLVIRAVDKATAPLRAINKQMAEATAPVRKLGNSLQALSAEAGLPKLFKGVKGVGSAIGGVASEAAGLGMKLAAIAGGAGLGLFAIVKGAVEAGDQLGMMAERVGLSVDAYAQLQFAAAQADVEQEAFNSAMDKFNRNLGDAKAGGGSLLQFLQKVSPTLAQQVLAAKGTDEALGLMARAFEKVTDPGKRAALASAAFGKGAAQMGQFLGQGSKAIEEQRKRFLELAGSQASLATGADSLDMAMRETETAFLGLRNAAAAELFPALTELSKGLSDVLAGERGNLREWAKETGAALIGWVKGGGLKQLVGDLKDIAIAGRDMVQSLGGIKTVAAGAGLIMSGPLIGSVVNLGSALWKLGGAVLPLLGRGFILALPVLQAVGGALAAAGTAAAPFVAAAAGAAAAGYAIYKNWEGLKELFTDFTGPHGLLATLKEMFSDIHNLLPTTWLSNAGKWWGEQLGITGGATGAETGAATVPAPAAKVGGAIDVNIGNLPRGSRVASKPQGDVGLNVGSTMALQE